MGEAGDTVVVRANDVVRIGVGLAAVVLAIGVGTIVIVVPTPDAPFWYYLIGAVSLGFVLRPVCSRGVVREVTFTPTEVRVSTRDGLVRRLPRSEVAHVWVSGTVRGGVVLDSGSRFKGASRLLVSAPDNRILLARRIGWFRLDELGSAATRCGYHWLGKVPYEMKPATLGPVPWPADVWPPAAPIGMQDPATVETLRRDRRRARFTALACWAAIVGAIIASSAVASLGPNPFVTVACWVLGLLAAATFFYVVGGVLRNRNWRAAERYLLIQPWQPVEAIVVAEARRSSRQRTVLFLDPGTGWPSYAMAVEQGGERGWLQPIERSRFLVAMSTNGKRAVLAPPDRRAVALLEEGYPGAGRRWVQRYLWTP